MKYQQSAVAIAAAGAPGRFDTTRQQLVFSADHHLYHKNVIRYSNRPFANVMEMNETIRDLHNHLCDKDTNALFLGDFLMGSRNWKATDLAVALAFCKTFKGHIFYAEGNHETNTRSLDLPWVRVPQLLEFTVSDKTDETQVVALHYGMRTWPKAHYGAFHLYGHSHGGLKNDLGELLQQTPQGRCMDVGVDSNGFAPVTWAQVKTFMASRTFHEVDHHSGRMDFSSRAEGKDDVNERD
jgi:calcineurin-like phosphoesterase family protein